MAEPKSTKKVVASTVTPTESGPSWQPTPEARAQANKLRLIAIVAWVLAIAVECVAIFALMLRPSVKVDPNSTVVSHPFFGTLLSQNAYFGWLIALIIVAGLLAVFGSLTWKKANRLDPASKAEPVRFFIQNQLGAIISVIAFLPLLILVILDKNLQGAQKGIAVAIAAVVLAGSTVAGTSINAPSQEQYDKDQQVVMAINGKDEVFWVKGGYTYHLCQESSDLQHTSQDNQIYSGTTSQAHAAGKTRLADRKECGYDPANPPTGSNPAPATTAPAPSQSSS